VERQRYLELGIFPEDTAVPAEVAGELCGVSMEEAEAFLWRYDDLSLSPAGGCCRAFLGTTLREREHVRGYGHNVQGASPQIVDYP
jgi:hypothetical protein